jgi:uncharacterized protein (TIGR02246 family)
MSERSESVGVVAAIGVAAMLAILLLVGGGLAYYIFARQTAAVRAQAEMARAAEQLARANMVRAQAAVQATVSKQQEADGKLAEKMPSDSNGSIDAAIESVIHNQEEAWNRGDIDQFMDYYWRSDELTFSSGGQTTRGWEATMKRYRDRYSTPEKMGKLKLDKLEITPLGDSAALVLGQWQVERESEPLNGNFSLVVRKLDNRWLIIHDHTSRLTE